MAQENKNPKATKNTEISIEETTDEITKLLKLPEPLAKDRVLTWISGALRLITPEQVKTGLESNVRVDQLLFQHLHLHHFLVRPLAIRIFRIFWKSLEYYFTDVPALYGILASNPKIQRMLDTEAGQKWLIESCKNGYIVVYNYTWLS